jgi:hypothetical protein
MKKLVKPALGALLLTVAVGAMAITPADARVYVGIGPRVYGGPYGAYWGGCYYSDPYDCYPGYYGGYYGPAFGFGWGGRRGGFHGGRGSMAVAMAGTVRWLARRKRILR